MRTGLVWILFRKPYASVDFDVMFAVPELSIVPGAKRGVLVWRLAEATKALSSAAVGGGSSQPGWVLNVRVAADYSRTDLAEHAGEIATDVGLDGTGITLFTAADIRKHRRGEDGGVTVDATCGIRKPTFAASADAGWSEYSPGTINIVAHMPVALTDAAAVNAVITMTEAKSQALADLDVPGTGTASDAVVVLWPDDQEAAVPFAGPRSVWGARLARASYEAVRSSTVLSIEATS